MVKVDIIKNIVTNLNCENISFERNKVFKSRKISDPRNGTLRLIPEHISSVVILKYTLDGFTWTQYVSMAYELYNIKTIIEFINQTIRKFNRERGCVLPLLNYDSKRISS